MAAGAARAETAAAEAAIAEEDITQPVTTVGELVVFGRGEEKIGLVQAATEGSIAGADLTERPFLRAGEILESVPGMMVTQHSGSGKANQYFLRGFNLDHGTDFGLQVDGVPMNFRTHGHGPGYLDINGVIMDLVQRIDYRKGPYRADVGDFNMVGGGIITLKSRLERPFVVAEGGDFDWKRAVAAGSWSMGGGDLLVAAQAKTYDGPWAKPENSKAFSTYTKYTHPTKLGDLHASLSTYVATWDPTEQIPERAIGVLFPDAYGAIDHYMHGRTRREIASIQLDGDAWRGGIYAQHYDWRMISNFSYFLEDPVNGDELEQAEALWTYGGRLEHNLNLSPTISLLVGGETRYDDIGNVALYHTFQGGRIGTTSKFAVEELSAALYAEATWKPNEKLTVFGGLRGDSYSFRVRPLGGASWTGQADDSIVLPKAGVSYIIKPGLAVYANWGQGFHSNDARGVTNPTTPQPGLVRGEGEEVGVRYERPRLILTASYWWMQNKSELIFVGDSGTVEPSNASERRGIEVTAFWRPLPGLAIDGVYTHNHARFTDSPGAEFIPGALKSSGELGVTYTHEKWNAGVRYRVMGVHPLIEDNSFTSRPTKIVNLRVGWTPGEKYELYGELLNAFASKGDDIEYYYESYLPQIDTNGPVSDIHSRAVEPRMIRAGVKVSF